MKVTLIVKDSLFENPKVTINIKMISSRGEITSFFTAEHFEKSNDDLLLFQNPTTSTSLKGDS